MRLEAELAAAHRELTYKNNTISHLTDALACLQTAKREPFCSWTPVGSPTSGLLVRCCSGFETGSGCTCRL
jgi:hypothetical protein